MFPFFSLVFFIPQHMENLQLRVAVNQDQVPKLICSWSWLANMTIYQLSGKLSYHQISLSLEVIRLRVNDSVTEKCDRFFEITVVQTSVKYESNWRTPWFLACRFKILWDSMVRCLTAGNRGPGVSQRYCLNLQISSPLSSWVWLWLLRMVSMQRYHLQV